MNRPPQHEPVAISREKCLRLRAIRNTPKPSMLTPTRSCLPRKFAPGKSHSQRGTRHLDPLPAYSPKNTKTVPTVIRPILSEHLRRDRPVGGSVMVALLEVQEAFA